MDGIDFGDPPSGEQRMDDSLLVFQQFSKRSQDLVVVASGLSMVIWGRRNEWNSKSKREKLNHTTTGGTGIKY